MALPSNYRQVAMLGAASTPHRSTFARISHKTNSFKDRLIRAGSGPSKGGGDSSSVSPFSTPQHGHPSFVPQKIGVGKFGSESRMPKPPKAPDKPLMPYMRYSRKVWDQVKASNQDLKLWEIGKRIRAMWKELPETDKQEFVDEFEAEKVEYEKALKAYHASPSYQAYLNAKNKGSVIEEKDPLERAVGSGSSNSKLDRRIDIQPAEDDEDPSDDGLSLKRLAHARYVRNQRLINEVFSDTVVPDIRTVVTAQRLNVLRRQVQSLTLHQKKLETELEQIESKFSEKKRKFVDAGRVFQVNLKKVKLTAPKLDEASFATLIERQKEILRKEAEERQKQTSSPAAPTSVATNSSPAPSPASTNNQQSPVASPDGQTAVHETLITNGLDPSYSKEEKENEEMMTSEHVSSESVTSDHVTTGVTSLSSSRQPANNADSTQVETESNPEE